MSFAIHFFDEPPIQDLTDDGQPLFLAHGRLIAGDYWENFYASLDEWTISQYESQWREAVQRTVDGAGKSALIVNYASPERGGHLEWWPMYRDGDSVFLQDHLLFFSQLQVPFSPDHPCRSLRDRQVLSEDGAPISEWCVDMDDLRQFLR
ncbi:MAG: hypothetical protein WCE75_04445 [Terracidiphilus sp.]